MADKISIAVLPFVNMSSDQENEYFSDGVSEEIINALSNIQGLRVISRTSSFYFKDKSTDLSEIGKQLDVGVVLEGSVRKSGKKVRITAKLINTVDHTQFWSETYNRELMDIFELQDEISDKVAQQVRENLGHFFIEDEELHSGYKNLDAFDLYLKSKFNFNKFTTEDIKLAIAQIEQAIATAPEQPKFQATKSVYYTYLALFDAIPLKQGFQIATDSAQKALDLDENNPEAHFASSVAAFVFNGDLDLTKAHINKALSVKPNFPYGLMVSALISTVTGDQERAKVDIEKMISIDPFSAVSKYYYGVIHMYLNQLDEALKTITEAIELAPTNINYCQTRGVILTRMGRFDEAEKLYNNMPLGDNKFGPYFPGLAITHASKGDHKRALDYLSEVPEDDSSGYFGYAENPHVVVNALLGDFDTAFQFVEKDIANKKFYLKFHRLRPTLNILHQDSRSKLLDQVFTSPGQKSEVKLKYVKSGINDKQLKQLDDKLMEYMLTEKPYLDKSVSLNSVADALGESANHVSQVINDKHKKNFFWFVNDYRINEMEELLKEPENKKLTLLSLAYSAGFNSKTTFNSAFKRLRSKTPSRYFKEMGLL